MLAIFLNWISIFFILYISGRFFTHLFSDFKIQIPIHGFLDTLLLGLALNASICCAFSLFFPIKTIYFLLLLALCCFYFIVFFKRIIHAFRNQFSSTIFKNKSFIVGIFILFLTVLFASTLPPLDYDSALYHTQAIQWIERYKVVPGLANLHGRFGFNSNSLLLNALFSMRIFFHQPIFAIHSFFVLLLAIWLYYQFFTTKIIGLAFAYIVSLMAVLYYYIFTLSSPSTDILANTIICILLLKFAFQPSTYSKSPFFLLLAVFSCTLKLSSAPILLLSLPFIYDALKEKEFKNLFVICFIAILTITPWLLRNYMISGYLVYPVTQIDLFHPDWKVPAQIALNEQHWIRSWAIYPSNNFESILAMNFPQWVKIWWDNQGRTATLLVYANVLGAVFFLLYSIFRYKEKKNRSLIFAYLVAVSGIIFWFFSAPDLRFGFAFLLIAALLPISRLVSALPIANYLQKTKTFLSIIGILAILLLFFKINNKKTSLSKPLNLLLPTPISVLKNSPFLYNKTIIKTETIFTPFQGDRCYDDSFPCVPIIPKNIRLREAHLAGGFRHN